MYRIHPGTGEVLVPHVFEDGLFGAADPANGRERHHIANRVAVEGVDGLRECLRKGWPVWMSIRGTRDRRLVSKGIVDGNPPEGHVAHVPAPAARPRRVPQAGLPAAEPPPASPVEAGKDAKGFLRLIASMSDGEAAEELARPRRLLVASQRQGGKLLEIAYAPFDHVNPGASVVIVGITPGRQQMEAAILEARRAMAEGLDEGHALARAKVHASFAGAMRANLVKLMDAVGLNGALGVGTAASLWNEDSLLAHFTSCLRYPTFVDGENYSRSPDLGRTPFLYGMARKWLAEELPLFPDAVFVPMGDMVSEALARIGREIGIPEGRILTGMPHAASSNNGPISRFLGSAGEADPWRRRFREISEKVDGLRAVRPSP